ncbi:hypothetical protein BH24ACT13_BH24ACT13_01190 [soil metagenome]|jgi:uncharacterized membrane protein YphA (DoxX/SURF4 family)
MTTETGAARPTAAGDDVLPGARTLGKGLAALRVFMGLVLLLNGLAKLFGFSQVQVGPYVANLIDREAARFILRFEVFENEAGGIAGTRIPAMRPVADLMLDNWGFFGWGITLTELVVGALLVVGLASRGAALVGLGLSLFLALMYASSNRWMFEQPHEYVPMIILAMVPSGRVWGLDGRVLRRRGVDPGELRGWPF